MCAGSGGASARPGDAGMRGEQRQSGRRCAGKTVCGDVTMQGLFFGDCVCVSARARPQMTRNGLVAIHVCGRGRMFTSKMETLVN